MKDGHLIVSAKWLRKIHKDNNLSYAEMGRMSGFDSGNIQHMCEDDRKFREETKRRLWEAFKHLNK